VLLDIEPTPQRNQWKRLVLVGCHPDQLSVILGHRWLPADLIVLCDRDLASHVATRYAYLAQQPALAGTHRIGARLAVAAATAREEAKAREVPTIELELDNHEAVARDESVIDLAGSSDDDEGGDILEFELQSGRTLRARYGTALVAYDETADVNPFARVLGRDIRPGRAIVVPDLAFVTEARGLLPVKVLARGWVNIYHSLVEAGLGALPGQTLAAKARYVQQQLAAAGARQLSEQAIVDWLKVADHKKASAEVIRPHAPMRYRAYMTFAKVIGIEADMAEKIWREGIEPLRIDRRRAGSRMAHAFSSVLVDPHGCGARLSDEVRDKLRELRRRAREHVDGVVKTKTVGREDTA
jgi:hypothetical protein